MTAKPVAGNEPEATSPEPPVRRPLHGPALVALLFALAGIPASFVICVPALSIVGVVMGHTALADIDRSRERLAGRPPAIAALVIGYGWILIWIGLNAVWPLLSGEPLECLPTEYG